MFLKADPVRERGYFAIGIFLLIASFVTVIWLEKFASEIFATENEQSQQNAQGAPPVVSL